MLSHGEGMSHDQKQVADWFMLLPWRHCQKRREFGKFAGAFMSLQVFYEEKPQNKSFFEYLK